MFKFLVWLFLFCGFAANAAYAAYVPSAGSNVSGANAKATGGSTTSSLATRFATKYWVGADFGADLTGATDATAAVNACLTALGATGGACGVEPTAKLKISGGITLPANTALLGNCPRHGQTSGSYYTAGCQLALNATTITMGASSMLSGLTIIQSGMALPPANDTAAQALVTAMNANSLIAVTVNGADATLTHLSIYGFGVAIFDNGQNRPYIDDIEGDNSAGLAIFNTNDIAHVHNVHWYPYLTIGTPSVSNASLQRAGYVLFLESNVGGDSNNDWSTFSDIFGYGYNQGYSIDKSSLISCVNCKADQTPGNSSAVAAFSITGGSANIQLINPNSVGYTTGLNINSTGGFNSNSAVQVLGGYMASNATCVNIAAGRATIIGMDLLVCPTNSVVVGSGAAAGSIIMGNYSEFGAGPYSIASSLAATTTVLGNTCAAGVTCPAGPAIVQAAPSNKTGTTSTSLVMLGAGQTFTPTVSGTVQLHFDGYCFNNTINDGVTYELRYGTGSVPANAAAVTGSLPSGGAAQTAQNAVVNQIMPCSQTLIATGLSIGTAYWVDVAFAAFTGGTANVNGVVLSALEMRQ